MQIPQEPVQRSASFTELPLRNSHKVLCAWRVFKPEENVRAPTGLNQAHTAPTPNPGPVPGWLGQGASWEKGGAVLPSAAGPTGRSSP